MSGVASRMVDSSRQGALQGKLASVSVMIGPLIAAQALAAGSANGVTGAPFRVAGALVAAAALIVAVGLPRLQA